MFTTASLNKTDHNPSATIAKESFLGTAIFLLQYPSFTGERVDRSIVIVGGYWDASSYTVSYLPHYYTGVPLVTSNIKKSYVPAARLASLTSDDFKQHTEEEYMWRDHAMRA